MNKRSELIPGLDYLNFNTFLISINDDVTSAPVWKPWLMDYSDKNVSIFLNFIYYGICINICILFL